MEGRIAALVLAAGSGSRFGGGKLLARVGGRPILQHVLDRLDDAGLEPVIVVLGADAGPVEQAIRWRSERRVRNPDPGRGLSSSLRLGMKAIPDDVDAVLIALGDQPLLDASVLEAVLAARIDPDHPIAAPRYTDDGARNPVLLHRAGFGLVDEAAGDRGLGPVLAAHRELVRDVPVVGRNPDVDTRADLVAVLEEAWAIRVRENARQVDRHREVPDGADFYAPVSGLFVADPARTDEPALDHLLQLTERGETWLDIGAGAGRYALPLASRLAAGGGRVIALEPSDAMRAAMVDLARDHGIANVEVVAGRWPEHAAGVGPVEVALIAHVGYDIERIGPFLRAMEQTARRACVALLMDRQPSSVADACWPLVWGEERVPLPALPDLLELLEALRRPFAVTRFERVPRRFESREQLLGFLRRQLWVAEGSAADARLVAAANELIVDHGTAGLGLRDQRTIETGVVTWQPAGE